MKRLLPSATFTCIKCGKAIETKNDLHAPYYVYSETGVELAGPLCHDDWVRTTQAVIDFKMEQCGIND